MAGQTFDELKQEMAAAQAVLEPQIRGLDDLSHVSLSSAARTELQTANNNRKRRYGYLSEVSAALEALQRAMDNLYADGYPQMALEPVSAAVFDELQGQKADEAAAHAQFQLEPTAQKLAIDLGEPVMKPT